MRNLKKFLALVLAMMMTLSLMVTVNAAADSDFTDKDSITENFAEGVEVLKGMGVFEGYPDGSFGPKGEITRAETAAIVYRLATGDWKGTQAHLYKDYQRFDDVTSDKWFAGYINYCANAEWIAGYGNGKFGPNDKVSGYQAAAMILRAVGYGKNGEFVGSGWRVQVANVTRSEGLLINVDNTTYANTLNNFATRELVAEILFQAAQIPTVTWSMLGGYNKYQTSVTVAGQDNLLNPSLGYMNYGLDSYTGAVVGNDATGEAYTLLSMKATAGFNANGDLDRVTIRDGVVSYAHGTSNVNTITAAAPQGDVTLAFNKVTGLDLFGHKATVWYDCRTSDGEVLFGDATNTVDIPSAYRTTYAVVDKANLVKTVFADDLKVNGATASKTSIYSAAVAAGFSKSSNPAMESKIFDQFSAVAANAATKSPVGMYRIISNNAGLNADVVISLNQEVARIDQVNTTVKEGEYIFLGTGNSSFGDQLASAGTKGMLLFSQLSESSHKTLGDVVTANQIVGTAYGTNTCNLYGTTPGTTPYLNAAGAAVTAAATNSKDMLYDTTKLEPAFTGTISTYKLGATDIKGKWIATQSTSTENIVTKVTLTDGKTYDLSGITGSQYEYGFDTTDSHLINGVKALTSLNTAGGITYDFYTDEVGRFIGVGIPNNYGFLYTTFADYEIGALGTGTIDYYVYGVDWNGNIVKNRQIKGISMPVDDPTGSASFEDLTAAIARVNYPNGTPKTLADGYNLLPVTMKNQGATDAGNQIKAGVNTRFVLDPDGAMSWYDEDCNEYGNRFLGFWDASLGTPAASYTWTVTKADAANGFKRVYNHNVAVTDPTTAIVAPAAVGNNTDYLLTNDTKFIVVTGSGTSDLSVKTYNGISELVGDGTSADISINSDFKGDNVYFITSEQRYGNTDTSNNRTIDTVIMSNTNLTQYGAQSLYFSEPGNAATGVKLAGDPGVYGTVSQYKLYADGQEGYYWISDTQSAGITSGGNTNNANGTAKKGDFYTLTPIGKVGNETIYKAVIVNGGTYNLTSTGCSTDNTYNYVVVNNVNTAEIDDKVFKVGGAKVVQVYGDNQTTVDAAFPNGLNITDVQTLNNAVSMGKGDGSSGDLYTVNVAVVYSGVNVSCIYVTNIATT